jgi:hypothetical protein
MELNYIGLTAGIAAFLGIWFGHVAVRKIDFVSPSIWVPAVLAFILGFAMEVAAIFSDNLYVTIALGILGMTFLWDAIEFPRQHRRVQSGHAPANPANPRHARILAENSSATTIDWLKRDPTGRELSPDELRQTGE